MEEIKSWNADVIALQEVDNPEPLKKELVAMDYFVQYYRRDDSPLGILLALKPRSILTPISTERGTFSSGGQIYGVIYFYYRGVKVTFVAVHLKAKQTLPKTKAL